MTIKNINIFNRTYSVIPIAQENIIDNVIATAPATAYQFGYD